MGSNSVIICHKIVLPVDGTFDGIVKYLASFNPRLTEPIFVTQLTEGWLPPPSDVQNEPLFDASLEASLNIDTKISTNMPSVWLL